MTTIEISDGAIRGAVDDGVVSFKGIPYAAPPIGDLRWRPPQPPARWAGTRDATQYGSDCYQMGDEPITTRMSEDCLYANIWAPASVSASDGLPVLVWIHGGAYVGGGSSIPFYDGSAFARQGIVVVSFNYRLSRFGFFAHPAILAAATEPVANCGYLDQIRALEWVRDNIADFGGDPRRVTVVGESAGGASVVHLIVSPAVEGLFAQAMVMSGGGREALLSRPLAEGSSPHPSAATMDKLFAVANGIMGDGPEDLARLRALPPETLVADDDMEHLEKISLFGGGVPCVPTVDGKIVVGEPQDHFEDGSAKRVPIIIGTTAIDIPLHFPPDRIHPLRWFGEDEAAAREAFHVPAGVGVEDHVKVLLSIGEDMTMHEPAHYMASSMRTAGQPAWVYRFTYTAESTRPSSMAQVHAGELPFLFDTLLSIYGDDVTDADRATARAFNTYVGNFVKTGDPNGDGLPDWSQGDADRYELLDFTLDDGPRFGPDPRGSTIALVGNARARARTTR